MSAVRGQRARDQDFPEGLCASRVLRLEGNTKRIQALQQGVAFGPDQIDEDRLCSRNRGDVGQRFARVKLELLHLASSAFEVAR